MCKKWKNFSFYLAINWNKKTVVALRNFVLNCLLILSTFKLMAITNP